MSPDPQSSRSPSGDSIDPPDTPALPDGPADSQRPEPSQESPWLFWRGVLITLAVALGIRQYLLEARYIPSGSMLPGLQIQDRLLVEKLSYRNRGPRRGEIVVFHAPYHFDPVLLANHRPSALACLLVNLPLVGSIPGLQNPACDAYIKRVVAIAGDHVVVDPRGQVTLNGQRQLEPYVKNWCPVDSQGMGPCRTLNAVVPPGHVLTLGDNRANSWDGRFWPGGAFLPTREIIGRAFWRFYPFNAIGSLEQDAAGSAQPLKGGSPVPSPPPGQ